MRVIRIRPLTMVMVMAMIMAVVVVPKMADGKADKARCARQGNHPGRLGQGGDRLDQGGFQSAADPKHDLGLGQHTGLRWGQRETVRRRTGRNQQQRYAGARHHLGGK